jgi:pyruvate dehydrogenase E2 component (dihydrolipoamide acetyltransferase)
MAILIEITQLSPTMTEGILVEWTKKPGDLVSPGDPIAAVETDKAVMDLESFEDGLLLKQLVEPQTKLPVGAPIAILGNAGEDFADLEKEALEKLKKLSSGESNEDTTPKEPEQNKDSEISKQEQNPIEPEPIAVIQETENGARIKASPLAKKLAANNNIDLRSVAGSGPRGRIVKKDIEASMANQQSISRTTDSQERASDSKVMVSMMRQVIAKRLTDAKSQVPHFYLTKELNITELLRFRSVLNKNLAAHSDMPGSNISYPPKISVNDFVIRAVALTLRELPEVNAEWHSDHILLKGNIDVGVAVAIEDGLLTPIIRNTDQKGIYTISAELKDLAARAKKRKLQPNEYSAGSFTISNLGMFGINQFQAIINAPEAALLAIGSSKKQPVYDELTGDFIAKDIMNATLSCDHRIVDGAKGALFMQKLAFYLEKPGLLMQ